MQTEPRSGRMADCVVLYVEDSDIDAYLFRLASEIALLCEPKDPQFEGDKLIYRS